MPLGLPQTDGRQDAGEPILPPGERYRAMIDIMGHFDVTGGLMFLGALIGALRCCGLGPSDTLAQLLQLAIFRLKRVDQVGALVWRFPIIRATIG